MYNIILNQKRDKEMTLLTIKTIYDDRDIDDDEDEEEVEGNTLIECVANFNEKTVEELEDLIKTGKWIGGEWKERGDEIIFDSDVVRVVFSI